MNGELGITQVKITQEFIVKLLLEYFKEQEIRTIILPDKWEILMEAEDYLIVGLPDDKL
jgi:hypothetical protein